MRHLFAPTCAILLGSCSLASEAPRPIDLEFARAVSAINLPAADEALAKGADLNALFAAPEGGEAESVLMGLASSRATRAVEYLIQKGADVDLRSIRGRTALMYAAMNGRIENIRLLLAAGADPAAVDHQGDDVLRYARRRQMVEAIAMIEEAIKKKPR